MPFKAPTCRVNTILLQVVRPTYLICLSPVRFPSQSMNNNYNLLERMKLETSATVS